MPGLFGILDLGQRSLQVQQQGVQVAGHNLANVNNPAYARQRLSLEATTAVTADGRPMGNGADVTTITQLRSPFIDQQTQTEASVTGFLEARQNALQQAQTNLGQVIDRMASGAEGTAAAAGVGGQHGLGENLGDLFTAFQSLSSQPTDPTERLLLIQKAQTLATSFQQTDQGLADLRTALNGAVTDDVAKANQLLTDIARLNGNIARAEQNSSGAANDLRDARQEKLETLAKLVRLDTAVGGQGGVDISVSGTTLVQGVELTNTLEAYDAGNGQLMVRARQGATPLALTGGGLQGTIEARDTDLKGLREDLTTLAARVITAVNAVHRNGFGLGGTTGADFFTGSGAADIGVNSALVEDPAKIQAAAVADAKGNNGVALALAQLAGKTQADLGNMTFNQSYAQTVANLGQALSGVNQQSADQKVVTQMLQQQRDSLGGVSLDEEMTDLVKYQRAYQASARLISTIDQMLDDVLNLKR